MNQLFYLPSNFGRKNSAIIEAKLSPNNIFNAIITINKSFQCIRPRFSTPPSGPSER